MADIRGSITELIGKTPLLALENYGRRAGLEGVTLLAKLEYLNPTGSVKDRAALQMLLDAEADGRLAPGATVIEPTSGNTGIGLAAIAAARGYHVILTLPETMSLERRKLLAAYGAEIVLTPGKEGMKGAIAKAQELHESLPGSFIPGQFDNPSNAKTHLLTTGPEIWEDRDGRVDIFVAGVGSGGTITGVGAFLKQKKPSVQVIAVEPASSAVLSGKEAGAHGLQGIGAGFVPGVLDTEVYDEVIPVKEEDAYDAGRRLAAQEGILAGISSGAALYAAELLAGRPENRGKMIVVLLPDSGDRYLSTPLFADNL